jgi:hypothetical protein
MAKWLERTLVRLNIALIQGLLLLFRSDEQH